MNSLIFGTLIALSKAAVLVGAVAAYDPNKMLLDYFLSKEEMRLIEKWDEPYLVSEYEAHPKDLIDLAHEGWRLCFVIGYVQEYKDAELVLRRKFGDYQDDNIWAHNPLLFTGTVKDREDVSYVLSANREPFVSLVAVRPDKYQVSVCADEKLPIKSLKNISIHMAQPFEAYAIYLFREVN